MSSVADLLVVCVVAYRHYNLVICPMRGRWVMCTGRLESASYITCDKIHSPGVFHVNQLMIIQRSCLTLIRSEFSPVLA